MCLVLLVLFALLFESLVVCVVWLFCTLVFVVVVNVVCCGLVCLSWLVVVGSVVCVDYCYCLVF